MDNYNAYNLVKSFYYAICGIIRSFWHERNLRIHFFVALYIIYFSNYYELSKTQYAILFFAIGAVITCELINTAIEATVDLITPVYSDLAKIAKDAAAGAVLVSAIASLIVGYMFFWDVDIISKIWSDIISAPFLWLLLLFLTVFLVAWPETQQLGGKYVKSGAHTKKLEK